MGKRELTKVYHFTLRPTDIERLSELSEMYEGNRSLTIRFLIEAAYQKQEQK